MIWKKFNDRIAHSLDSHRDDVVHVDHHVATVAVPAKRQLERRDIGWNAAKGVPQQYVRQFFRCEVDLPAGAVRRAVERMVVHVRQLTVLHQLYIELDAIVTLRVRCIDKTWTVPRRLELC